jgi:hypothetical protein
MKPQRRAMPSDAGEIRGSVLALIPGKSLMNGLIPWSHMMHSALDVTTITSLA